jgi:hypothetical protein
LEINSKSRNGYRKLTMRFMIYLQRKGFLVVHNKRELHLLQTSFIPSQPLKKNSREVIEQLKKEVARQFQIAMDCGGKSTSELAVRRNGIAKPFWMAKKNMYI